MSEREITGRMVFAVFALAFSVIIGVNVTLAFQAIKTFPGLEVGNSYVASQSFDAERKAQLALGWIVGADVVDRQLRLLINDEDGQAVKVANVSAILGRATHVKDDQNPAFAFDGVAYVAPVDLAPGNWNLRVRVTALDGTEFKQRIILYVGQADG